MIGIKNMLPRYILFNIRVLYMISNIYSLFGNVIVGRQYLSHMTALDVVELMCISMVE